MLVESSVFSFFGRWVKFIGVLFIVLLIVVISPLLILTTLPIYMFRFLVVKYTKYFRPDLGKILSPRSATFTTDDLYGKPKANLLVPFSLSKYKNIDEFRKKILNETINARTLAGDLANPELQQSVSSFFGFSFWKWESNFQIEDHIYEYDGSRQIPILTTDILNELSTEYLKTPFTPGRSPWKMIVFPKSDLNSENANIDNSSDSFVIVFLCHHCLTDGFSITNVFLSPMDPGKEITSAKPRRVQRTVLQNIMFNVSLAFRVPFEFVSAAMESFDVNGCHIPEEQLSENIMLGFSPKIPTSYIKNIAKVNGVSFTSVLMAAFAGAMRTFFLQNRIKLPETIHAVVPFPVGGHSDKLRNVMSVCMLEVPIGQPNVEERVQRIEKNLKHLKRSTQPITMFYLLPLIGGLPTRMARAIFKQSLPTALISNFPGPQEQCLALGHPLEDVMFTAGLLPGNIGIGFSATSYNGHLRIQGAFNESLGTSKNSRTIMLDNVMVELQKMAERHIV